MQSSIVKNDLGTITIDNEVIGRMAGLAAMECYGVVGMAAKSIRDGLVHLLKIESLTKGVRTKVTDDGELIINLHIIVEYGTNIVAIANTLIENVKYKLETSVGLTVREVNIFVESIRV
ncbi:MAG: Asp23/Gls24 family envelope stress response protein [Defluviitaleaceae bacterium]|nr:Asp23/Gls24 family envelope stress response protein [Defluviitaleaceae bacterium]MCL2274742.1 Asp23/Gls24 family envelope stress response protein [Defluviitaleaceae bacterium]